MLKIIYSADGEVITDLKAEEYAWKHLKNYFTYHRKENLTLKIGTEFMLSCFVLYLIEHKFPCDEVEFYYGDKNIPYDDIIGLDDAKTGESVFPVTYADVAEKILIAGYRNLKERRK